MKTQINTFALLTVAACILVSCAKRTDNQVYPDRIKVKTISVSHDKMVFPVRTTGILFPAKEIRLSFKTGGIIKSLYADEGSHVRRGDLLAILEMPEIEAQVSQAENGYEKSLRDYQRARNLYTDSVATLEQLQNAETALNVAKAIRDAALFNREHSRILAPEDGVILKRIAQVHEMAAPGYPVFVFGTSGKHWKVRAGVADRDFVRITAGDSARLSFDAWPGRKFTATVSQLSEAANPVTGTYEIELELAPAKERMASGFVADIEIFPADNKAYFRIPVDAITEANEKRGIIYVVTDSFTARKTAIHIAEIYNEWAALDSGLAGGELIVTEGSAYLGDGDKVEVVR